MLRFSLLVVVALCAVRADDNGPVVCYGKRCVRGLTVEAVEGNVKNFEGFFGIPYAKPPVGELRLKVRKKSFAQYVANCIIRFNF